MNEQPFHEHQKVWFQKRPALVVQLFPANVLIRFSDGGVMRVSRHDLKTKQSDL